MRNGKAAHRCAEFYAMGVPYTVEQVVEEFGVRTPGMVEKVREADKAFRALLDMDSDLPGFNWREAEVWVALHPTSLRVRRAADRFDKRDGELLIGVDLIFESERGLTVRDWKTGWGDKDKRPEDSAQIKVCGYVVCELYKADHCRIELASTHRLPYVNHDELDALDLQEIGTWVRQLAVGMPARTTAQGGEWCSGCWCPLRETCPESKAKKRKSA